MKFLCVCQYGHSRSVALCRVLHQLGKQAVPVGHATSPAAIPLLGAWADKILILQECFRCHIPVELQHKVVAIDVGPDVWVNPYHLELQHLLRGLVEEKLGLSLEPGV